MLTSDADMPRNADIDDSIAIPQTSVALLVGAFSAGVIKGIYNAAVNLLWGTIQLAKLPFTSIVAAGRYEAEVWASVTPAERATFADSRSGPRPTPARRTR